MRNVTRHYKARTQENTADTQRFGNLDATTMCSLTSPIPTPPRLNTPSVARRYRLNGIRRPLRVTVKVCPTTLRPSMTKLSGLTTKRRARLVSEGRSGALHRPRFVQSSKSAPVGTRKMVNYAWPGRSQGKPWWRTVAILTCKSIVGAGYRGERLI